MGWGEMIKESRDNSNVQKPSSQNIRCYRYTFSFFSLVIPPISLNVHTPISICACVHTRTHTLLLRINMDMNLCSVCTFAVPPHLPLWTQK